MRINEFSPFAFCFFRRRLESRTRVPGISFACFFLFCAIYIVSAVDLYVKGLLVPRGGLFLSEVPSAETRRLPAVPCIFTLSGLAIFHKHQRSVLFHSSQPGCLLRVSTVPTVYTLCRCFFWYILSVFRQQARTQPCCVLVLSAVSSV